LEALGEKMKEVVILLQNIKADFQTEIDHKINEYCSSKREKVQNFILEKNLTEDFIIESCQDSKRKKSKEFIEKYFFQKENTIQNESQ
jgi:Na+-translocating ferredoxin:NAD+ oxidoreductase RnfG subunit